MVALVGGDGEQAMILGTASRLGQRLAESCLLHYDLQQTSMDGWMIIQLIEAERRKYASPNNINILISDSLSS